MSAESASPDELPRLLSGLADCTLDAADEQRLAELLQTDPAARARYYDHAMLSALLRREGRRAAAQDQSRDQWSRSEATPRPMAATLRLSSRTRPWLLVLAASVLLCLLVSFGEATGVTRLVPTLIRIVTGEGALVIEVDDPGVSVTLDGADVTISGAGIHELRLRPGTHKFVATKDGQPLREEVVTIERGGRQIVKVSRLPLASSAAMESQGTLPSRTTETRSQTGPPRATDFLRRRRVLIILASHDFYYPDYIPVRDTLIRAGVQVLVAAPTLDAAQPMPGNPGHTPVAPDLVLATVTGADYDALYFCGGTGVEEFIGSGTYAADARRLIAEALAAKKCVTALGTGPLVLADAGVLSGVRATCYPFEDGFYIERLKSAGAIWVDEPAVVSGLIITSLGPNTTREFCEAVLQQLGARPAAGQK